jgi:hypothetical protein
MDSKKTFEILLGAALLAAATLPALAPRDAEAEGTGEIHPGQPGNDRFRPGPGEAPAEEAKAVEAPKKPVNLHFGLVLQNFFFFMNDKDFDRTEPFYNVDGQTSGFFGTIFTPGFALDAADIVRIYYEAELGINVWSKNNPDENSPLADDIFLLKHREIWAKVYLADNFGAKIGYQRFLDPTGLFVNHWIGAGTLFVETERADYGLTVAQVPDATHEGLTFADNNFKHDAFLTAFRGDVRVGGEVTVSAAALALVDTSVVRRPDYIVVPALSVKAGVGSVTLEVDGLLQCGQAMNVTVDGGDALNLGWALQGHVEAVRGWLFVGANALVLSYDDAAENNAMNLAALTSGKNRSATLMITEDELRDKYNNFDERMAVLRNGLYEMRAGMALFDVVVRATLADGFLSPGLVAGTFVVLNPDNAMGHTWGGFEGDLLLDLNFSRYARLRLAGGVLVPGKALSAHVNEIDSEATDLVYMIEAVLEVRI